MNELALDYGTDILAAIGDFECSEHPPEAITWEFHLDGETYQITMHKKGN